MYFIADESKIPTAIGIEPTSEEKLRSMQWALFNHDKDPNEFSYFFGEEGTIIAFKVKFDSATKSIELDKENPFTMVNINALGKGGSICGDRIYFVDNGESKL